MGWSKELWQVRRRQLNDGRVPAGLGSVEIYLGMVCEMFIVGVTCVDWEVWFLPLDSWLFQLIHILQLSMYTLYNVWDY